MANLYKMKIKIIGLKNDRDDNPIVNFVGPDPDLDDFKLVQEGIVPEMVLINYDQKHYNLVIAKDSLLTERNNLSEEKEENKEVIEEVDEDLDVVVEMDVTENN